MSWRALTEDDLKTVLSGTELATYRALGIESGDSDAVTTSLTHVAEHVRGFVTSVQLGPAGTLPPNLISTALAIACVYVMSRAGGRIQDPSKVREKRAEAAEKFLVDMVLAGKLPIEVPETVSEIPTVKVLAPTFAGRHAFGEEQEARESVFGRESEDGL